MEALFNVLLEVLRNPHSWGGLIIGAIMTYTAQTKGLLPSPDSSKLASVKASLDNALDEIEELKEEMKVFKEWRDELIKEKLRKTDI